jgi:TRAP-type C4-dicarboxylate transport system permease small subunit
MGRSGNEPESGGADAPAGSPLQVAVRGVYVLIEFTGGLGILTLMLLTVSDALLRSFANRPLAGANDLTQVMLVVVVACALPLCVTSGRAITIDLFVNLMPKAVRSALHRLSALSGAAALGYLAWRCLLNAREAAFFGETTMLMQIPFGPFYLALAIGLALSSLQFLADGLQRKAAA